MRKSVLIIENNTKSLSLDESVGQNQEKAFTLGGVFTEFDIKNRNERIYTADKFMPCLEELKGRMNELGAVYGEFDHPDVFDTSLQRASHVITDIGFMKEDNNIQGKIQLLSTRWGKEARAIVNDKLPLFVSSRAAGITESDGSVTLKKLFTYDIVADPGFGTARMSCMNESCGYSENTNFRIYEMEDESKINELFTMNKNDMVTKKQLTDYSKYLVEELGKTKQEVKKAMKQGDLTPKKLEELLSYYEGLQVDNTKIIKYLDYLAEKLQIVVKENKELKGTAEKLVSHNDYLAENLEKNINYSEYLAENLDNSIKYQEYIAENLDNNIKYSEYIAENVDNGIKYSEYIVENLENSIKYSEYLAENVDNNIKYSEYIAENLETNIEYAEYIAEHVDNNIQYSEYLAENLEGNIEYSEYIAEHLDDNIAYSDYIAESLDKTIEHSKSVVQKLNERTINEDYMDGEEPENLPMPPFEEIEDEEEMEMEMPIEGEDDMPIEGEELEGGEGEAEAKLDQIADIVNDVDVEGDPELEETPDLPVDDLEGDEGIEGVEGEELGDVGDVEDEIEDGMYGESMSNQIDKLIEEAKKRKVSETEEHHFLKFLNKSQVDSFYSLTQEERENVALYINEKKGYYTNGDVLKMMKESLEINKTETQDEKLVRLIPGDLHPVWENLDDMNKKSVLSSAKLYPNLVTEDAIEHFWLTRKQLKVVESTKKLVSETPLLQEDVIAESEMNSILERFRTL